MVLDLWALFSSAVWSSLCFRRYWTEGQIYLWWQICPWSLPCVHARIMIPVLNHDKWVYNGESGWSLMDDSHWLVSLFSAYCIQSSYLFTLWKLEGAVMFGTIVKSLQSVKKKQVNEKKIQIFTPFKKTQAVCFCVSTSLTLTLILNITWVHIT